MPERTKEIRVGDEWGCITNTGILVRRVKAVEGGIVEYLGPGDVCRRECSVKTFKRWLKGAHLEFATDWSGRDLNGVTTA